MTHIQQRRDQSAIWTSENPVLFEGESGHETDTGREKMGDGETPWVELPYKFGVDSVAGKTGEVELVVADVTGAAPLASPVFTGSPAAPTPSTGDDDTSVATTAFVKAQGYITEAERAEAAEVPHLKARTTFEQVVTANTTVPYFTLIEDTHDGWDAVTWAYTAPVAGIYRVTFQFKWNDTIPSGFPVHRLRVNGASRAVSTNSVLNEYGGGNFSYEIRLAAEDVITIFCAGYGYTMQSDGLVDANFLTIDWVRA